MVTTTSDETVSLPLGTIAEADIRLNFGGGELTIHPAPADTLVSGTFEGGAKVRRAGLGRVAIEPRTPGLPMVTWRALHWDVGIAAAVPVRLRLHTGANRSNIDLTALRISHLEIHTGASETTVRMPAAGRTLARVECGFAAVTLHVPQGVAARIRGRVAVGSLQVDERRFPRTADGWASPDYETAADRVDLAADGGFGSIRVA